MNIRPGTPDDLETLVEHRRLMFSAMGYSGPGLDRMTKLFRPWLARKIAAGEYLAWVAVAPDSSIAGGVGLWFVDWPPVMMGTNPLRGYILNVYVKSDFRRQGIARRLTDAAMACCRDRGIDVVFLHASDYGRPLYEALGFKSTNEMLLVLDDRGEDGGVSSV